MNEKKYIELDEAIKEISRFDGYLDDDMIWRLQHAISKLPAADVRPAVQGHWVKARGSWCTPGGDPVWECSECGKGQHVYGIEHGTYGADVADGQWVSCPNCGADMMEKNHDH